MFRHFPKTFEELLEWLSCWINLTFTLTDESNTVNDYDQKDDDFRLEMKVGSVSHLHEPEEQQLQQFLRTGKQNLLQLLQR